MSPLSTPLHFTSYLFWYHVWQMDPTWGKKRKFRCWCFACVSVAVLSKMRSAWGQSSSARTQTSCCRSVTQWLSIERDASQNRPSEIKHGQRGELISMRFRLRQRARRSGETAANGSQVTGKQHVRGGSMKFFLFPLNASSSSSFSAWALLHVSGQSASLRLHARTSWVMWLHASSRAQCEQL